MFSTPTRVDPDMIPPEVKEDWGIHEPKTTEPSDGGRAAQAMQRSAILADLPAFLKQVAMELLYEKVKLRTVARRRGLTPRELKEIVLQ